MSIVLLCFGVFIGCVTATTLWLSGAGLGLALLGYIGGCAAGGVTLCLWLIIRASLSPAPRPMQVIAQRS